MRNIAAINYLNWGTVLVRHRMAATPKTCTQQDCNNQSLRLGINPSSVYSSTRVKAAITITFGIFSIKYTQNNHNEKNRRSSVSKNSKGEKFALEILRIMG